ncbi:transporter substrate-binding domain-containing protein [Salipiger sp. IMCC34102]|uniref:transporter substrate-binding domain-containing protein n=1 Tax=Salipiger sp. IMCC34102 TaxID=2510647 RepID=UPI00101B66F0|nr:transporter substrate-binding domain-containing protein [Salipiger sp. IMCC34102]RYH04447.1 transporter substrate-binding domain-containing protein [Salipiger sp. IMCC34102]
MRYPLVLSTLLLAVAPALAAAQQPVVDPAFLPSSRPDFGNRLALCVLTDGPTARIDRIAARDLADVLLMEPHVVDLPTGGIPREGAGVWPEIRIALQSKCMGVMGAQLSETGGILDWLTVTQPYLARPYVLLSDDGGDLADLAPDARIGVPLYTPVDRALVTLIAAVGRFEDLVRIPYDRPAVARALLDAGDLDAVVLWEPHLDGAAFSDRPDTLMRGDLAPLNLPPRDVAILLPRRDTNLRVILDEAILALRAEDSWPEKENSQ